LTDLEKTQLRYLVSEEMLQVLELRASLAIFFLLPYMADVNKVTHTGELLATITKYEIKIEDFRHNPTRYLPERRGKSLVSFLTR
jgi:hypothetical protein